MTDDPPDRRDRSPTTASFEEWLDQQAKSQGISRQELFERLVSSYWTLNELVQLLDDSGNTTSLADIYPGDGSESPDGEGASAAPTIGGSGNETNENRRQSGNGDRQERRRRRREERDRRSDEDPELRDRIEALDDRIDDLESELGDERERGQSQDGLIEALADRLSGIEADLGELESASASGRESLSDEQATLERRLDELESDLDGRQKQLASEQERLRSRLNSEFDELETILEYLVSQTDDLDAGLATVEQRHDEALSQLQWEREAMRSLLREASAHDAHVGECEVCGEGVNLDLLAEPYCSECDSLLTGIEERDKWLFFSDIVVTAEETPVADESRGAPFTDPRSSEPEPTPDPSAPPATEADPGESAPGASTGLDTRGRAPRTDGPASARSTGDDQVGTDDRSAPGRESHPKGSTDDPSEPSDSGIFEFGADDSGSEPAPDPDSDADATGSDGERSGSFNFGGAAADTDSPSDRDGEATSDADADDEAAVDAPFGDLDDLERQETSDDE